MPDSPAHRMRAWIVAALLPVWWTASAGASAAAQQPNVPDDSARPPARVTMIDGRRIELARWDALNADVLTADDASGAIELPRSELLVIRLQGLVAAAPPAGTVSIETVEGNWLSGRLRGLDDERVLIESVVKSAEGEAVSFPLEALRRMVWFRDTLPPASPPGIPEDESDVLRLTNGDRLRGDLIALTADSVSVQIAGNRVEVPVANLAEIRFNPALNAAVELPSVREIVTLRDGGEVVLQGARIERGEQLFGTGLRGESYSVPLRAVESVVFLSERVVPLSRVAPVEITYTPFLTTVLPLSVDRNARGGAMRMGDARYALGLGMQSRTVARWTLPGDSRMLVGVVGMDDLAGTEGTADARITIDELPALERIGLTTAAGPVEFAIPLTGRTTLTLEVDFGARGNVRDYVDWGDVFLIRTASAAAP